MASDLGWKTVELQIEALVPGLILAFEAHVLAASWFGYQFGAQSWMPSSEFVKGAVFVAVGYSLGVSSSILSRAVVDSLSEKGPRAWVFSLWAHARLDDLVAECRAYDPKFPSDIKNESAKRASQAVAEWNAVFRSAVRRTTRGQEVDRRRSQGRFVRNLFFPALVVPLVILTQIILIIGVIIAIALAIIFLYAYAEYIIFAEAYDIAEQKTATGCT